MALEALAKALPSHADDIGKNLLALEREGALTDQQLWGTFLASACAVATPAVLQPIEQAAREAGLTEQALSAARGAAAIMAQNNIYFRAVTLLQNPEYRRLRSGLRMGITFNPGVAKDDFDLWCVAVSAIHGCPDCLDAHESALKSRGVAAAHVQTALRIAAVVHAASRVMMAEAAASG